MTAEDVSVREAYYLKRIREAERAAFRRGQEAMRERAADDASDCYHGPGDHGCAHGRAIAASIRALLIEDEEAGNA